MSRSTQRTLFFRPDLSRGLGLAQQGSPDRGHPRGIDPHHPFVAGHLDIPPVVDRDPPRVKTLSVVVEAIGGKFF